MPKRVYEQLDLRMRDIRIKSDAYHAPLKREVDPFHLLPSSQRLQYLHALSCSSLKISYLIPGLFYCHNTGTQTQPLSPDARLVATFHGLRKARLRGLVAELDVIGLLLDLLTDLTGRLLARKQ